MRVMAGRPHPLAGVEVMTFDCYGTLIDWEGGAKGTLRTLLALKAVRGDEDAFFRAWERAQRTRIESYAPYRQIAAEAFEEAARAQHLPLAPDEAHTFADSIATWRPFGDTVAALKTLKRHLRLGIISNIDDDILAETVKLLGVEFDLLQTAQQARAYKPSPVPFQQALERLGVPAERVAHAAFGFEYDIAAASELGFRTVLVRRTRTDFPSAPVPDATVANLAELASLFA
jgi:2-haloacid dehalogenase